MINQTPGLKFLLACCFLAINSTQSIAQITPDNTLGAESSRVVPNGGIDKIDGGALRDRNLFHSFKEFNINNGQRVYFSNPSGIENILTRVTGKNASNILGTLGVDGAANLFLINPNGIVFGENARLDVNGSFVGSTANGIEFLQQGLFSATNPETVPLLTVNPSALFFNNQLNDRGNITNLAQQNGLNGETNVTDGPVGLQVPDGKTLALVGGNVLLDNGNLTAFGGRIEIGSVTGTGKVNLDTTENGFIFNYDAVDDLGEIRLENRAIVDVSAGGGGSINVIGKDINILGGSSFRAGMRSAARLRRTQSGSIDSQAGDINLNAKDKVEVDNSFIINDVNGEALGNSGDINIISNGSLSLTNGAIIRSSIFGKGDSGNIFIAAGDVISLDGSSYILNNVQSGDAVGNAGKIDIITGSLTATNGAQINSFTRGQGNAGSITIQARDAVTFDGVDSNGLSSGSFGDVFTGGVGNGGEISITAGTLKIINRAGIFANTFDEGNGGNINIEAKDLVEILSDGSLESDVREGAVGNSGDITIKTANLIVKDSQIGPSVFGEGNAGNFKIIATNSVELSGQIPQRENDTSNAGSVGFPGGLFAQIDLTGKGTGGNLTIETGRLSVSDGSKIQAATFGDGDAGNVFIRADEIDLFETEKPNFFNTGIFAGVQTDGRIEAGIIDPRNGRSPKGNGGDLTIEARKLSVRDGAEIFVETTGEGNAGKLFIRANESVNVTGVSTGTLEIQRTSKITASASEISTGNGGSLTIETPLLNVTNDGFITSDNQGSGIAGNINIRGDVTRLNDGKVIAQTTSNDGGNINFNLSQYLLLRNGSQISTTAGNQQFGGNGGNIDINTPVMVAIPRENSDITANAFSGNGGNINISTEGIFGIGFQEESTPESDITASSEFGLDGNVEINTPDIDPTKSLIELPDNIIDNSDQVYIACVPGSPEFENTFISIGTGGIPFSPLELLQESSIITNWVSLPETQTRENRRIKLPPRKVVATNQIVEATGWIVDKDGNIEFVAQGNHISSKNARHSPALCSVSE
ncbi:MAG: filamentous hemagglutinin N-terminal domain-containing protein [Cyanobacteria bacterium J06635_10]